MFCPNCQAEYVEGAMKCPNRHVVLWDGPSKKNLPPSDNYLNYHEVLETYNPVDIAIIQSMLVEQEIDFYFQSAVFNQLEPTAQPARLMVREDQVEVVKVLLKDLDIRFIIPFK